MTAHALTTFGRGTPRLKAVATFLAELVTGVREGFEIAYRYEELARLSDAELARRGLRRENVPQAAVSGRVRV